MSRRSEQLKRILESRGIPSPVVRFSRNYPSGWLFSMSNHHLQRIGQNFLQAKDFAQNSKLIGMIAEWEKKDKE